MAKQIFPEPTAGVLIFNPNGKMLLVKSHKFKNRYVIPGGHIELGERIEDTIKREAKEETGLDVYDPKFISYQEFIFDKAYWKKRHFIFLSYACKTKGSKVKLNGEAEKYIWTTPKEALKLNIEPYSARTIRDYIKKFGKN